MTETKLYNEEYVVIDFDNKFDRNWYTDKLMNNWRLPPPANWFKRLPYIRAIRAAWFEAALVSDMRNCQMWLEENIQPPGYFAWVQYAITKGWC